VDRVKGVLYLVLITCAPIVTNDELLVSLTRSSPLLEALSLHSLHL
jgi:hypothetical protein